MHRHDHPYPGKYQQKDQHILINLEPIDPLAMENVLDIVNTVMLMVLELRINEVTQIAMLTRSICLP